MCVCVGGGGKLESSYCIHGQKGNIYRSEACI